MKVLKFGGTSVGSAERMKKVAHLIEGEPKWVVLSAMSGTTNALVEIARAMNYNKLNDAKQQVRALEEQYEKVVDELYATAEYKKRAYEEVKNLFDIAWQLSTQKLTPQQNSVPFALLLTYRENKLLSIGELLSTRLFHLYLLENGVKTCLLPALEFMRLDVHGEPDNAYIKSKLKQLMDANPGYDIYLTQGFICLDSENHVDNLKRGGSDYTASLIGAAIKADEIQIWTDIDGIHNNDPRFVEGTCPVRSLHFEEAAELAYFGAKILHPTCIQPAKQYHIPVRLLNTLQPESEGTLIHDESPSGHLKAVAAKDNIISIRIHSGRMLLAYGFLRKVFEIFERHRTPIDMITTSEVGVSLTIDDPTHLDDIVNDLQHFGTVEVEEDMVIICVVGDLSPLNPGFPSAIVNALNEIPVRMISYGGSAYNLSFLVKSEDKIQTLKSLSSHLFSNK